MAERKNRKVLLVYFSGTGGTKRVADAFASGLENCAVDFNKLSLDTRAVEGIRNCFHNILESIGLVIILYPVHAFNAPAPVFDWIRKLPESAGKKCAVISVSAGGEASLNRASRIAAIRKLEKKGISVFYENMLIMPCNWVEKTPDHLALELLRILPAKTERILDDILDMKTRRIKVSLFSRLAATVVSGLEKLGGSMFGRGLSANDNCTGCSWCEKQCPRNNIRLVSGKPQFGRSCIMCFRCIYGCPEKAIFARRAKFMVIREGFDLDRLEKKLMNSPQENKETPDKRGEWKIVEEYLSGFDG